MTTADGTPELLLTLYAVILIINSACFSIATYERLRYTSNLRRDLMEGFPVSRKPKSGFVSEANYEVKALLLSYEYKLNHHTVIMSAAQDVIPLPLSIMFISHNFSDSCNISDWSFLLCAGSVMLACLIIGGKSTLLINLSSAKHALDRQIALAEMNLRSMRSEKTRHVKLRTERSKSVENGAEVASQFGKSSSFKVAPMAIIEKTLSDLEASESTA